MEVQVGPRIEALQQMAKERGNVVNVQGRVVFLSDGLIVADRGSMTNDEILDQIKSLE
jgi:hypothetical protein